VIVISRQVWLPGRWSGDRRGTAAAPFMKPRLSMAMTFERCDSGLCALRRRKVKLRDPSEILVPALVQQVQRRQAQIAFHHGHE
jgi:hypothetical protein